MTQLFDLRSTASRFRTVALLEAVSWAGLLIGMYFKYFADPATVVGVKLFGPIHGVLFLVYLGVGFMAGREYRWRPLTWLLALLAGITPLCSVIFVIWADKAGKLPVARAAEAGGTAP
ncbi:integral membrane protein [Mycobacteroides chelonae]|nr:integral membrane protein [Mycobacteroides chelonae]